MINKREADRRRYSFGLCEADDNKTQCDKEGDERCEREKELLKSGQIEALLDSFDAEDRRMYLCVEIDETSASMTIQQILYYNKKDEGLPIEERKPIKLLIASPGGDVDMGFGIIDAIKTSKTPVYTINIGTAYSMGFMICLSGHKRYSMPNSRFLIHDGSVFASNSTHKMRDTMEFLNRGSARMRSFVLNHSRVDPAEYDSKARSEWYMFADEAKERGFVDYIVGEDCDIDEII